MRSRAVVVMAFFLTGCVAMPSGSPPSGGGPDPDRGPPASRPECIACDDTASRQAMCEASSASCSAGCSVNDPDASQGCQASCIAQRDFCNVQASISHCPVSCSIP